MRALIIEDDCYIAEALKSALMSENLVVEIAPDGESGAFSATTNDYDIILLDTMLPKKNGREVCRTIRMAGKKTPILSISAKADPVTKVELLEAGVDDYIGKPFVLREVVARVRALLRRPHTLLGEILTIGDLTMDTRARTLTRGKASIRLTRKEFALLEYLLRNQGSVVSRGLLLEHVWDEMTDPFSNTIEAHIMSVRRKLRFKKSPPLIHTVPGLGYKLSLVS
jgi:DNA-binding response OmpR family regulator